jgi:hypothetical protein
LPLELLNQAYWKQGALVVAKAGRAKMKRLVETSERWRQKSRRKSSRTFGAGLHGEFHSASGCYSRSTIRRSPEYCGFGIGNRHPLVESKFNVVLPKE